MTTYYDIFPAPQRILDPSSPHYRPGLSDYAAGGKYLCEQTGEDFTDLVAAHAIIDVSRGTPSFKVSFDFPDPLPPEAGRINRVNLYKQKAGWRWLSVDDDYRDLKTLISVERSGRHYYALSFVSKTRLGLTRFRHLKSEPRLRPTALGDIVLDTVIGHIQIRGFKTHPVYENISVVPV